MVDGVYEEQASLEFFDISAYTAYHIESLGLPRTGSLLNRNIRVLVLKIFLFYFMIDDNEVHLQSKRYKSQHLTK